MRLISRLAGRALAFVVARPRLDFFLRRQIARMPGVANRMRRLAARTRQQAFDLPPIPVLSDDKQLSEPARQVLRDLRQAMQGEKR